MIHQATVEAVQSTGVSDTITFHRMTLYQSQHESTRISIYIIQRVAYSARWKDRDAVFILDIDQGILLHSKNDPVSLSYRGGGGGVKNTYYIIIILSQSNIFWKKPFSYLRHSSDDGHSKMKLKCAIEQSRITEVHVRHYWLFVK